MTTPGWLAEYGYARGLASSTPMLHVIAPWDRQRPHRATLCGLSHDRTTLALVMRVHLAPTVDRCARCFR